MLINVNQQSNTLRAAHAESTGTNEPDVDNGAQWYHWHYGYAHPAGDYRRGT